MAYSGVLLSLALLRVVSSAAAPSAEDNLVLLQLGAHWTATKVVSHHSDRDFNGSSAVIGQNESDDSDTFVNPRMVHPASAPPAASTVNARSSGGWKGKAKHSGSNEQAAKVSPRTGSWSRSQGTTTDAKVGRVANVEKNSAETEETSEKESLEGVTQLANGDTKPRMLVMGGCSGSSFIMLVAMKLLEAHGIPFVYPLGGDTEMLKPDKNQLYTKEEGMGMAMKKSSDNALKRGGVLAFQVMTNMLTQSPEEAEGAGLPVWNDVAPDLKDMGVHVVYAKRENLLDHAVCKVRDCFNSNYGIPVDADGERSHLCFNRRTDEKAGEYKANMIPGKLVKMMQRTAEDIEVEQQVLRESFKMFRTVTMEDLLAYQYGDDDDMHRSLHAWKNFLISWGVTPDQQVIRRYLKEGMGSHKPPGPHSETIYNIDEVKEELAKEGLDEFLRS